MRVREITRIIEELCPLTYSEDFDNVGLLVGDNNLEVTGVLVALDTLEETVEEAILNNCNLIVGFHPIIFSGLKKITGSDYVQRAVIRAIKNDIAIYAMHTALDNSFHGVSARMCDVLGLENREVLLPQKGNLKKLVTFVPHKDAEKVREALFRAGAGNVGNYSHCSYNMQGEGTFLGEAGATPVIGEAGKLEKVDETWIGVVFERHLENHVVQALLQSHPYEEVAYDLYTLDNKSLRIGMGMIGDLPEPVATRDFLQKLKDTFGAKLVRHSAITQDFVSRIAVLGGSGSFAISRARSAGAHVFVTADLKYHDFYKAEGKLLLADIGHYESEQFTKNLLVEYLNKKITNFAPALPAGRIILSKTNTNPINYL